MDDPKQLLKSPFSCLELCERPVKVIEKAFNKDINALHDALSSLDPQYNPDVRENARFPVPDLYNFCSEHAVFTPYSLRFQKCGKRTWKNPGCSQIRSLAEEKELVFQYQPTPQPNKICLGHYLSCEDALKVKDLKEAATDLSALSSLKQKKAVQNNRKLRSNYSKCASKVTSGWKNTCIRETFICIGCGKPIYFFVKSSLFHRQKSELQRCIESNDFIYRTTLINKEQESDHSLHDVIFQQVNLSCNTPVEHQHYNPIMICKKTSGQWLQFQTDDICAISCSKQDVLKDKDLKGKVDCAEIKCLPICKHCLDQDLTPVLYGQVNQQEAKEQNINNKKSKKVGHY